MTASKIIQDCGGHDGSLTEENFLHGPGAKTCMPSQYALCLFKVACKHMAKQNAEEESVNFKMLNVAPRMQTSWAQWRPWSK